MFVVGFGLLGATVIVMLAQNTATAILIGFGFGGSLLALFMRVGGGIFTKAADVGADLVGKVEAGIPEDDPRNAATIADNVGDNVGDCAGMAADLFESYGVILVATLILAYTAFTAIGKSPAVGLVFSLIVPAIGILASIIGVFVGQGPRPGQARPWPRSTGASWLAAVLTVIGTFFVAQFYVHDLKVFCAVVTGVVLGQVASRITEYYTSTETLPGPRHRRVGPHRPGHDRPVGHQLRPRVVGPGHHRHRHRHRRGHRPGRRQHPVRPSTWSPSPASACWPPPGIVVSEDSFGPVSDNAAGIAEMTGEFERRAGADHGQPRRRGQHHQGHHQGLRHRLGCHRRRGPLRLLHPDHRRQNAERQGGRQRPLHLDGADVINVANPKTFIGLLIGGSIAFLFSSLAIRAVGRSAGTVVQEVRRQFREHPGIMDYTETPEYGRVIDICTAASLRELATPALLAILSPVVVGFGIGDLALGAFLAGTILTGQLMANFLSNSGGAWDNAKKYIEDGNEGGKGSEAHKAAVIGDTVGDPFKDTAGPGPQPADQGHEPGQPADPAGGHQPVKSTTGDTAARYIIAAAALLVILAGVAFSKRKVQAMDTPVEDSVGGGEMPTGPPPARPPPQRCPPGWRRPGCPQPAWRRDPRVVAASATGRAHPPITSWSWPSTATSTATAPRSSASSSWRSGPDCGNPDPAAQPGAWGSRLRVARRRTPARSAHAVGRAGRHTMIIRHHRRWLTTGGDQAAGPGQQRPPPDTAEQGGEHQDELALPQVDGSVGDQGDGHAGLVLEQAPEEQLLARGGDRPAPAA